LEPVVVAKGHLILTSPRDGALVDLSLTGNPMTVLGMLFGAHNSTEYGDEVRTRIVGMIGQWVSSIPAGLQDSLVHVLLRRGLCSEALSLSLSHGSVALTAEILHRCKHELSLSATDGVVDWESLVLNRLSSSSSFAAYTGAGVLSATPGTAGSLTALVPPACTLSGGVPCHPSHAVSLAMAIYHACLSGAIRDRGLAERCLAQILKEVSRRELYDDSLLVSLLLKLIDGGGECATTGGGDACEDVNVFALGVFAPSEIASVDVHRRFLDAITV